LINFLNEVKKRLSNTGDTFGKNMTNSGFHFEPLYYGDRLYIVNRSGYVGVVTLWSRIDFVRRQFELAGIDLSPDTSPIAVFGNLYGNGLRELLRNLLYNPQIRVLLVCGRNRSGSREELINFFVKGVEPCEDTKIQYRCDFKKVKPVRIAGTKRIIDNLVTPSDFAVSPKIFVFGDLKDRSDMEKIGKLFSGEITCYRGTSQEAQRVNIPLPEVEFDYFPSNPRSHVIVCERPLEAWKEIIFRICRFGRPVQLLKGERIELQNLKVVVEHPEEEDEGLLRKYNFDPDFLKRYQKDILSGHIEPDETYNYGHRIRKYFGVDSFEVCIQRLKKDSEDRKCYVALWDTGRDLASKHGHPCLVSLFFRKFDEKLTLSATFRTHNALDAWLVNMYGLIAILKQVAQEVGMESGAITVYSHSITIDKRELDRAKEIAQEKKYRLVEDPQGYFRITLDKDTIVVEHCVEDIVLKTYRGKKASRLQHEITRDCAISDVGHAIYLGRQLQKAEECLKSGRPFVQE